MVGQLKPSRRLLSQDLAEVCFVAGYITALIGSLVAISGIFTRNQARTRLYMEAFGCAMVILGVFVVFFSLRMRANKDSELVQLRRLFQQNQVNSISGHWAKSWRAPPMRLASVTSNGTMPDLLLNHQPMPAERSGSERTDLELANCVAVVSPSGTYDHQHGQLVVNLTKTTPSESEKEFVPDGSLRATPISDDFDEKDLSSINSLNELRRPSQWTPCTNDCTYPDDLMHETAAIEAALSIVLTVATLAGFKPDGAAIRLQPDRLEHFCCLHHTVQLTTINTNRNPKFNPTEQLATAQVAGTKVDQPPASATNPIGAGRREPRPRPKPSWRQRRRRASNAQLIGLAHWRVSWRRKTMSSIKRFQNDAERAREFARVCSRWRRLTRTGFNLEASQLDEINRGSGRKETKEQKRVGIKRVALRRMQFAHLPSAILILILTSSIKSSNYVQFADCSRRFLTGLIIGTLLARNGMQGLGGPQQGGYSAPSSYQPAQQQQQPMFIIIPSGGGKSGYKKQEYQSPSMYPAMSPMYTRGSDPYLESLGSAESQSIPETAARRLSPYFRRRSIGLLKQRQQRPLATNNQADYEQAPQETSPAVPLQVIRPDLMTSTSDVSESVASVTSLIPRPLSSLVSNVASRQTSAAKALKQELSVKTNDMATRLRSRHRQLWSARNSAVEQVGQPLRKAALRRSRAGRNKIGIGSKPDRSGAKGREPTETSSELSLLALDRSAPLDDDERRKRARNSNNRSPQTQSTGDRNSTQVANSTKTSHLLGVEREEFDWEK